MGEREKIIFVPSQVAESTPVIFPKKFAAAVADVYRSRPDVCRTSQLTATEIAANARDDSAERAEH